MKKRKIVLALNGNLTGKPIDYLSFIDKDNSLLLAADGGALFLEKLGLLPDIVIGDFDSLTDNKLKKYKNMGIKIIKFSTDKDETDAELAINYCLEEKVEDIIIIGSMGGRFDQQLANVFLLEYAYHNGLNPVIREPRLKISIIKNQIVFKKCEGDRLSLIPLSEKVSGVSINGCKYPLNCEDLFRYKTRGISNIIINMKATVKVLNGTLLYIKKSYEKL